MQEKLIEHWLDSIGERGYQSAFVQMLAGEGHSVVHSTRHMPIEFGKDVISIDINGVPCAYQLKGNPGSRLTLSQWREIRDQITELVEQPIIYPGVPNTPHRCFLVTNGEVEEEVSRAIDDLNRGYERRGLHENQRISVIARGKLLNWANKHAGNFWPEDFSVHEKLIKMYNIDGRSPPELGLFSEALDGILRTSSNRPKIGKSEFRRAMFSAAMFVSFATRNYAVEKNYDALIGAWITLMAAYAGASEKYEIPLENEYRQPYELVRGVVFDILREMLNELDEKTTDLISNSKDKDPDINRIYLSGFALCDRVVWNARAIKVLALLALIRIEYQQGKRTLLISDNHKKTINLLTKQGVTKFDIWGEGAIVQVFAHILAQRLYDGTVGPNMQLYYILQWIARNTMQGDKQYIATPYHDLEECLRDKVGEYLGINPGSVKKETQKKSSYLAEGILHCFVRSNLKSYAKIIWPDMTRLMHNSYVPEHSWEFCLWRSKNGKNISKQFTHQKNWNELQAEAADIATPSVPKVLREDPVVLLAFIIYFPHRALPEVLRYLHYAVCGTWFLPFPRPDIARRE